MTLLLEKGYHATGLKEILDTVKVPKGSFYTYFSSKEQYAVEVIDFYIQPFLKQLSDHLQQEQDGLLALKRYFNELIELFRENEFKGGCLLGNLMGEIGDTSTLCQTALKEAVKSYTDLQAEALLRGQQQGTVRQDRSAQDMADLLFSCWQGAILRMKIEQSVLPLHVCCQFMLDDYFKAPSAESNLGLGI